MKLITQAHLSTSERSALSEFTLAVKQYLSSVDVILFGSKARGDDTEFSDIDILVITDNAVTGSVREQLAAMQFEIEMKYDVIIGLNIKNRGFWNSSQGSAMPLHANVQRDGILL